MRSNSCSRLGTVIVLIVALIFVTGIQPVFGAVKAIKIVIDGRVAASDSSPVVLDERTYVPLRVISENLGCRVEWRNDTGHIVINRNTASTPALPKAPAGKFPIIIDGQELSIPRDYGTPFINSQYRMMIPLRAVGEALDCQVEWLQGSYTVDIKSKPLSADQQLLKDLASYRTNIKLLDGTFLNSSQLAAQDADKYSGEQMQAFQTYFDELKRYPLTVTLPDFTTAATSDLTIMGRSYLTAAQLKEWIRNETPRIKSNMEAQGRRFQPIPDLADLYIKIGAEYGVRGDIAFCQSAKETGYWQFMGQVQPWQNNYCGLSATGTPMDGTEDLRGADPGKVSFWAGFHGAVFTTPAAGVEAHIQHLYAYASKNPLPSGKTLLDPRFVLVNRGCAPTWVELNSRWAVPGRSYGQSIIMDYWAKAVKSQ
ncbi:MAG: copper amine oxidase [Syntrophomonadaceae bacterium]|nr:copper amine oxidase [Syntrophomonadaceae bacterium]